MAIDVETVRKVARLGNSEHLKAHHSGSRTYSAPTGFAPPLGPRSLVTSCLLMSRP